MGRLTDKVVLISGTAGGQGRAAALRFAREGASIVGGDLNSAVAAETTLLVRAAGGTATHAERLDVTNEASVHAWINFAIATHGRIDVMYANAGAVKFESIETQSLEDWRFTVDAELTSVWLSVRAAWPHLKTSQGTVLCIGSTAGLTGSLTNKRTAHTATKGGVIAMTRQFAAEGAPHGIRANCISPGLIHTPATERDFMTMPDDHPMKRIEKSVPLKRYGTADEVVNAAVFLCSDEASYITGANLVVDGGWSTVLPGAQIQE